MEYDSEKIDEITLALLYLVAHGKAGEERAWKGFDWATMDRLHEKGFIGDPKSTAKSVILTEKGARRSAELFKLHFSRS